MNRKIVVNVTQEDIDKGCVGDLWACPIAKALARRFHRPVWAGPSILSQKRKGKEYFYNTPDNAHAFMTSFDSGETVAPFTFVAFRNLAKEIK